MRNVIILGTGRSGTSMAAGTLASAGYWMGNHLYGPNVGNPKGMFEDREINAINEAVLARVLPKRHRFLGRWLFLPSRVPAKWQRWLSSLPVGTEMSCGKRLRQRIETICQRKPFCFKDPRFCYTLPVWRPYLADTVFLCVFRDPSTTAFSILKQFQTARHLRGLTFTHENAVEVWMFMYQHILEIHSKKGEWLFLHYNQIVDSSGLDRLADFTGARIDRSFPDGSLRRSYSDRDVPKEALDLYDRLCERAGYESGSASP